MNNENKKQEWINARKKYITGTDAACLLGISPWGSSLSVWLDKTGQGEPLAETEPMRWGRRLEDKILEGYAEAMGCELVDVDGYDLKTNDKFPRLACSLDGWNINLGIPVDAKNIRFANEKWGENGTDEFPDYYKTQLQVQMMVMGAPMAHLAALFSGQELRIYQMAYDEDLADRIVKAAEEFWPSVENMVEPQPGGDCASTEYLKDKYAIGTPDLEKDATDEFKADVAALVAIKEKEKELEEQESEYTNRVKAFMGDATVVKGLCTWKNSKDRTITDWKTIAEMLLEDVPSERKLELMKINTKTTAGARVLRLTARA